MERVIKGVHLIPVGMANAFLINGDDGLTLITPVTRIRRQPSSARSAKLGARSQRRCRYDQGGRERALHVVGRPAWRPSVSATHWVNVPEALKGIDWRGRILIDATNAHMDPDPDISLAGVTRSRAALTLTGRTHRRA
jgi:hypothetical protein